MILCHIIADVKRRHPGCPLLVRSKSHSRGGHYTDVTAGGKGHRQPSEHLPAQKCLIKVTAGGECPVVRGSRSNAELSGDQEHN